MKRVIIDANNLAARSFYALPSLTHEGQQTGAMYGFLREVCRLMAEESKRIVFAFDEGPSRRTEVLPNYKYGRKLRTIGHALKDPKFLREQIGRLRNDVLPSLGFANVLYAEGYEADDVIAQVVKDYSFHHWMIASSDHDLYQLIGDRVEVYDPGSKAVMTKDRIMNEKNINPREWAKVKAIIGCKSDDIPGVRGVGEFKACAYINGGLGENTKAFKEIERSEAIIKRNMKLVTLPYEGTPSFTLKPDAVTERKWRAVMETMGVTRVRA